MNLLSFPGSGQAQNWFLWTKQYTENARKTLWHFPTVWLVMQTALPFFLLQRLKPVKKVYRFRGEFKIHLSCCHPAVLRPSSQRVRAFTLFQTQPKVKGLHINFPFSLWICLYANFYIRHHKFAGIRMSEVCILNISVSLRGKTKLRVGI